MVRVHLIVVGESKKALFKSVEEEFAKRLTRFCKLTVTVIPNIKGKISGSELKGREAGKIRDALGNASWIALDENGKQFTSQQFAYWMESEMHHNSQLVFVVGGAEGFDSDLLKNAKMKLSLSPMTFTHQMIRGILLEQVYRAFTIIKGHPYHNT